jgi:hypothetical protein
LTALVGGASVFRGMAALAVWVPLLIAGALGLGAGVWVTWPLTSMSLNLITPGLIVACGAVIAAVGAVMWWWASQVMVKEASKWRPGTAIEGYAAASADRR